MMKKARIYILMAFIASILLPSCSQDATLENLTSESEQNQSSPQMEISDSQKFFASIFSRAISESYELRSFIREKALQRFDNDFNVFYHMVKNNIVSNDKTFRDVLIDYCEDVETFVAVEQSLPLLNIYVPSFKTFWEFDAYSWDLSDNEVGIICREDDTSTIFFEGEAEGTLEASEIPGFPCLVVGNSDRIRVSNKATRSSEATYEYVSDIFNPAKNKPTTRHEYYDIQVSIEPEKPYAKASDLNSFVIAAYNEFNKDIDKIHQRENIYFGITKNNPQGAFRNYLSETLYRFRIPKSAYSTISDQSEDPVYSHTTSPGSGNGGWTTDKILQELWNGKTYTLDFNVSNPTDATKTSSDLYTIFIKGSELFSFKKISVEYRNKTWLRSSKYTYTVNPADLQSKWVDPTKLSGGDQSRIHITNWNWNLYDNSLYTRIIVTERDDDQTINTKITVTNEFSSKYDSEYTYGVDKNQKIGMGFTNTHRYTTEIEYSTTKKSDMLGTIVHDFRYPVIVNDSKKYNEGYELYAINNGAIEVVLLPQIR